MKDDSEYEKLERKVIKGNATLIEKTLEAFGLTTRVSEINIKKDCTEYCLEIVMGTNLEELEKHGRDIALAVASPTGKVEMIIPIPGRSLIGIRIPKFSKEYLQSVKEYEEKPEEPAPKPTWRDYPAFIFVMIAAFLMRLAKKIAGEKNVNLFHEYLRT